MFSSHFFPSKLIIKDLKYQEPTIKKLNKAVDEMIERAGPQSSPLAAKQEEMNEQIKTVQIYARDKQNQLQDLLKEVNFLT